MLIRILSTIAMTLCLTFSATVTSKTIKHDLGELELTDVPERVVVLDWALAESLIALGIKPMAVTDVDAYQVWVGEPALPADTIDIGSRREPNLELIASLKPDLIIMSAHLSPAFEKLNSIAPTIALTIYNDSKQPYKNAQHIILQLGDVFERQQKAQSLVDMTAKKLIENGKKVAAITHSHPLIMVRFIDDKHVRVHSKGSLMDDTISAMSMTNSWQGPTNSWGFSTAPIEQLAKYQGSDVLIFGPLTEQEQATLNSSPLWNAMAFTREKRVAIIPKVWTFGSLIAMQRLSDEVVTQVNNLNSK